MEPIRVVGTNSRMGIASYKVGASNTAFWQRTPHQLGGPVDEIDIAFMNWTVGYSGENLNDNAMTIEYAWLERATTGQVVPLTFSGERQLVMPADTAQPYWMADPVYSSVWTEGPPARDEVFWLHVKGSVPANEDIVLGTFSTYSGSKFIVYDPANDPGTKDIAGAVPTISGQNQRTNGLPLMFGGRYSAPGYLSIVGLGDSILHGMGDRGNPTPVLAGNGFFGRASTNAEGTDTFAMLSLARSGESAKTFVGSHAMRGAFLSFANVVVEEYGTNDIGSNGSGNADQIYGRLQAIWQLARDAGVEKVLRTRLMPRTESATHTWIDFADQTPNNGWGEGGPRDELNALLENALSEGLIDVLVDTLTAVADPDDDHYWLTNGTVDYTTADGTHPNAKGYELAAIPFRAALEALVVEQGGGEPMSYNLWMDAWEWDGADSGPGADPNHDGIPNLLAYALVIPPLGQGDTLSLPVMRYDDTQAGGPWLTFAFRENARAGDILYAVMMSPDLAPDSWLPLSADGVTVLEETLDADPDGDGSAVLKQWRIHAGTFDKCFLRLQVSL